MTPDEFIQLVKNTDYGTGMPTWYMSGVRVLYEADCMLLNGGVPEHYPSLDYMVPGAGAYCDQLITYHERFGTHMPIPLRKHLLTELLCAHP